MYQDGLLGYSRYGGCHLFYLKEEGKKEVDEIKWENVGYKVRGIYDEVIKNYGKQ